MMPFSRKLRSRGGESGYALILVMFFLALLVLSAVAVAPTVLSNIQREKEAEMVWRGKQYARGVRLYYQKLHHFPTSLEDLAKPKTGIRFMRKEYKDPMNSVDGSWRLIYVGPNGQLIGSLMNRSISLTGQPGTQTGSTGIGSALFSGAAGGAGTNSSFGNSMQSGAFSSTLNQNAAGTPGSAPSPTTGTNSQNPVSPSDPNAENPDGSTDPGQPHSIATSLDSSNIIGGNIIGVGSKINKRSFRWYEKAKNYKQFEFLWDPSKDLHVGGASAGIGTPVQNQNGSNSFGSPIGSPNGGSPFSSPTSPTSPNSPGMNNGSQNPAGTPNPTTNPPLQAPPSNQ